MPAALPLETQREVEAVRARNGVTPVRIEDEGVPLASLPDSIYGYTYSPLSESTPLFVERTYQSFEVHKLTEGIVHVLGYLSAADAGRMRGGEEAAEIKLYPEPYGEANLLAEVSLERVVKSRPVSRTEGNYMTLTLATV